VRRVPPFTLCCCRCRGSRFFGVPRRFPADERRSFPGGDGTARMPGSGGYAALLGDYYMGRALTAAGPPFMRRGALLFKALLLATPVIPDFCLFR